MAWDGLKCALPKRRDVLEKAVVGLSIACLKRSAGLRIPAADVELLVTSRVRQWLLDPSSIYKVTRLRDPSAQRRPAICDLA